MINNKLVFKAKDRYKVELKNYETRNYLAVQKQIKEWWNVPIHELVEVILVQWNLVDDQYQQKSEVLHTFMPNKSDALLLNVEPSNFVFSEAYNTEFKEISKHL